MSHVSVRIPTALREFTRGAGDVEIDANDVGAVLDALGTFDERLKERLLTDTGELRPFVRLYVGEHDVRELDGLETTLSDGDVVSIIPAVAGG